MSLSHVKPLQLPISVECLPIGITVDSANPNETLVSPGYTNMVINVYTNVRIKVGKKTEFFCSLGLRKIGW